MLRRGLRLHLRNRFNFALQNQEPIVVEVDPATLEQTLNFFVVALATIDCISAGIVLVRCPRYDKG